MGTGSVQDNKVEAFTSTIGELFDGKLHSLSDQDPRKLKSPLRIDTYQRDYIWSQDKVEQLIADVISHNSDIHYYLGSLLFHEKENGSGLYVIDGQQRLTTLAIFYYLVHQYIPKHIKLSFESPNSRKNIRYIRDVVTQDEAKKVINKFGQIDVTLIVTNSQDQAFSFFDSQNTRGVRLSTTDLLKSYHLREISINTKLQENAARRWERLQAREKILVKNPRRDPAFELFERSLWRIRNWTRGNFEYETWDTVLNEFEKNRSGSTEAAMFPGPQNRTFNAIKYSGESDLELKRSSLQASSSAKNLPILIQQPLYDGYFFFLYSEKYSELLEELAKDAKGQNIVNSFITAPYDISYYLKELLVNVVLAYIDRFGKDARFDSFLRLTMLWFLQCRLERHNFRKRSPIRILKNINLFGLIEVAYDSLDLIERFKQKLVSQASEKGEIQRFKGIRKRYKQRIKKLWPKDQPWSAVEGRRWETVYKNFEIDE